MWVRAEQHAIRFQTCVQFPQHARQLLAGHMKQRGVSEHAIEAVIRQIELEEILLPYFAAAVGALPTYCEAAKILRQKLDVTSPRETREAVIDTYSTAVVQPTQLLDAYTVQAYKRLENEALNFRLAALQLTSAELSLKLHEPLSRDADEPEQIYFLFEWPFILAVAFALRITRTTIEVFDWTTVPKPPVFLTNPPGETYPDLSAPAPPWLVAGSNSPEFERSKSEENPSPAPPSQCA